MEIATKLRGLGCCTRSKEQRVLSIRLDGALEIVVQAFSPYGGEWKIIFDSLVGFRVLDERDTPEFWHHSIDYLDKRIDCIVYEVVEGGWLSQQVPHSPIMQSGFYSSIKEYLVGGDTYCVSILSEIEPKIMPLSESGEA